MKVKASELVGAALDWAVDKALNINTPYHPWGVNPPAYATDWAHGGPIIERERIGLKHRSYDSPPWWVAIIDVPDTSVTKRGCIGPTPLVSAMRCFVASQLGDEVDVPEELI